jgi:cell shape-determining protein MreD
MIAFSRLTSAAAAVITALWLQAALVGPLFGSLPVSIALVAVASIAISTGPTAGMCVGFATGLLADLGSEHPVGLLALVWLGLGVALGLCADARSSWRDSVVVATIGCVVASCAGAALLALATGTGGVGSASVGGALAGVVDLVLVVAVLTAVRAVLRRNGARFSYRAQVVRRG